MVIEAVVTTLDGAGEPNFAAMGVVWGDDTLVIRPYANTRTFRNLSRHGEAVVNVTDNVLLFAKSALTRERLDCVAAERVRGVVLRDVCHWREVRVADIVSPASAVGVGARAEVVTREVARGVARPFVGLCRAKHAVVEASILASRLRLLPLEHVLSEIDRLDTLVDKTGGPEDRQAMALVRAYVARKAAGGRDAA